MKGKKGFSPGVEKRGGRKTGVPNKTTSQIRQSFQALVENNLEKLQEDLDKLKPADRVKCVIELTKFVLPTLKATELTAAEGREFNPIVIHIDSKDAQLGS